MNFQSNKNRVMPSYGAFELKASYQKNLGMAILISSTFFISLCMFIPGYLNQTTQPIHELKIVVIKEPIQVTPPPPMTEPEKTEIPIDPTKILAGAKAGIPEPVAEEQAEPEATILSQDQLDLLNNLENKGVLTADADSIVFVLPPEPTPQTAEFVPHTEEPMAINKHKVPLRYPDLALRAGIEGTVYVAALVDKNGNVKDAYVKKESGANAGFEEAALEQALKLKYRPAFNNGIPVELWIIYRVDFKLK